MRVKTLLIVGLVLWGWSGVHAFPQEADYQLTDKKLQGVHKCCISIVIDGLGEDARDCGITESSLDAAVRLPLDRNGFSIDNVSADHVGISTAVMKLGRGRVSAGCTVFFQLQFRRTVRTYDDLPDTKPRRNPYNRFLEKPDPLNVITNVVVWQTGRLLVGPALDIGGRVNDALEDATNELIAKWLIDNPQ